MLETSDETRGKTSDEASDETSDKTSDETSDDNDDSKENQISNFVDRKLKNVSEGIVHDDNKDDDDNSEDNQISNFVDRVLKKVSKQIVNDDDSENDDNKKLLKLSKENVDLKSKVDVFKKKLDKSSEAFQKLETINKHDKTKEIEKRKTSNNSFKKIINESKELLKTIKKK